MSNGVRRLRVASGDTRSYGGRVDNAPGRHKVSKKTRESLEETNSRLDKMYDRLIREMQSPGLPPRRLAGRKKKQ